MQNELDALGERQELNANPLLGPLKVCPHNHMGDLWYLDIPTEHSGIVRFPVQKCLVCNKIIRV